MLPGHPCPSRSKEGDARGPYIPASVERLLAIHTALPILRRQYDRSKTSDDRKRVGRRFIQPGVIGWLPDFQHDVRNLMRHDCKQRVRAVRIYDDLLVDPLAACVRDVGPHTRPAGQRPVLHDIRLDQRPRAMADGGHRLALVEERLHELHRLGDHPQLVRVHDPARQQ